MTPESSVAAALDTMPEQRQAIAAGQATEETFDALARRVAVFEARRKAACARLAAITSDDWDALQEHVPRCRACRPRSWRRLRERAEYTAPGLVGVPRDDDEERRWVAFFQSPVRAVPEAVTRPLRTLANLVRDHPVLSDPNVVKLGVGVVGLVALLFALPSSQALPEQEDVVSALDDTPSPESGTPPASTPPGAGPSASPGSTAPAVSVGSTVPGVTTTNGQQPIPGTSTVNGAPGDPSVPARRGWAYASTPDFAYDQPVGQQVELHRDWQWGTWRRNGVERFITVIRRGEGAYEVRLPELGGTNGTVHVAISNGWGYPQALSCQSQNTRGDGDDLLVDVACFSPDGSRKNLPFAIVFVSDGPAVRYRGGAAGVTRTGPGQYDVTSLKGNGFAMVSAVGASQARCRTTVEATRTRVECDADTDWNLTYTEGAAIHHDPAASAAYLTTGRNHWSSNGETPAVTRTALGRYDVWYQGIGNPRTYPADAVLVSAAGPAPRYCRIWAWNGYSSPPKVLVQVRCYDQNGAEADADFALAYLRSP
ncbi:hypothetical protein [Lentzea sp.]|uniref:hypothetical protein n=1 Tax=Lentzea sp. TaxID=56099 RepID=UPI002D14A93E|nr:hypothetical protein [Lentzea sp.]HUQ61404.1 hypothetical protein [Lentzea sp.]